MNAVTWVQPFGTHAFGSRLSLAAISSAESSVEYGTASSNGSFWYSAKKAASFCSLKFIACWMADASSWLNRAGQPTTLFAYDAVGNRLSLIDPIGNITRWSYD